LLTVGFSFDDEPEPMRLNPKRKGPVQQPEDWRWSNYSRFAWEKATIAGFPIQAVAEESIR
jgi:hypothetical protein